MFRCTGVPPSDRDEVAQDSATTDVVGQVRQKIGSVTALRAGGAPVHLGAFDPVLQGDVIETGADGALTIVFNDGTEFNVSSNGRLVLDQFMPRRGHSPGSALISVTRGAFSFVTGELARTGSLWIDTPIARYRGIAQYSGMRISR